MSLALIWKAVVSGWLLILTIRSIIMSKELDALIANEAALETVVGQVVADNAELHAELTAAIASNDSAALQGVADKIAAQTAKLSALVPPAAPSA